MRTPPAGLPEADLLASLRHGWGLEARSLQYVPEGGGSHHWRAIDDAGNAHFVTVDDLDDKDWLAATRDDVFAGLERALGTAAALRREAGLDFVVAPILTEDNRVVVRLDVHYAVSVFPFLVGESYPFGPHTQPHRRAETLSMVTAVHNAAPIVRRLAAAHRPTFGGRRDLDAFLNDRDRPWNAGPFSEPAHVLLRSHAGALTRVVHGFDRLAEVTGPARQATVITHGEPHAANTMTVRGRLVLLDWDTAALAPPERDLWMIAADRGDEIARYQESSGREIDPAVMTLYRLRWYLDDIASAVRLFRNPHERTNDTQRWWNGLSPRLAELGSWQETLA